MLSLRPLQRALEVLYRLGVKHAVDDFVRPMPEGDPDAHRREVVLVAEPSAAGEGGIPYDADAPTEIAVLLDPTVARALRGEPVPGLSRFEAWCLALEGVSHFLLLAFRAANDRPVSLLELELQAEVDKFAVALLERAILRSGAEAHRHSRNLRRALYERVAFHDPPETPRGWRYRVANRMASRYAASLERRYVREARLELLVEELRDFYRASWSTKWAMAESA